MKNPIEVAATSLRNRTSPRPKPEALVAALLEAEKLARNSCQEHSLKDLAGTWQLGFVTGTKKVRQQAGKALGAGRFLPRILDIRLTYDPAEPGSDRGTVCNSVRLGPLTFSLSGPISFHPQKRILAFDFNRMTVAMTEVQLYNGDIRRGSKTATSFYDLPLKDRPFFTYFVIQETYIAARGKGGGLALWTKVSADRLHESDSISPREETNQEETNQS